MANELETKAIDLIIKDLTTVTNAIEYMRKTNEGTLNPTLYAYDKIMCHPFVDHIQGNFDFTNRPKKTERICDKLTDAWENLSKDIDVIGEGWR